MFYYFCLLAITKILFKSFFICLEELIYDLHNLLLSFLQYCSALFIVFKNANLKLYIEVNPEIRAKRRYKQLIDSGEKSIYQKILKDLKLRDKKDKLRKNSPLIVPNDAHIIDNNKSFKYTIMQINKLMENL